MGTGKKNMEVLLKDLKESLEDQGHNTEAEENCSCPRDDGSLLVYKQKYFSNQERAS